MKIEESVPLAPYTTLKVGGPAQYFAEVRSLEAAQAALAFARAAGTRVLVLGGGSNLVVSDQGVQGLVLRPVMTGLSFHETSSSTLVSAGAGHDWDALVEATVSRGLFGVECLSGIPGSVGATPVQNVGAYGQEISQVLEELSAIDLETAEPRSFTQPDCQFSYRDSWFKTQAKDRYLITQLKLRLRHHPAPEHWHPELKDKLPAGETTDPQKISSVVRGLRRSKSMLLDADDPNGRSCGSFFLNPVIEPKVLEGIEALAKGMPPHFEQADGRYKVPAAWLIERSGLEKGHRQEHVGISTKHCLALVAHDGATASQIVRLARKVRERVQATFGIMLLPEPNFWGYEHFEHGLPSNTE